MLITVLLLIGYLFNSNYGATISPSVLLTNKTLETDKNLGHFNFNDSAQSDYVQLPPGMKIYFYTTDKKNLLIGPKLLSDDAVIISILNQTDDLSSDVFSRNSVIQPSAYKVLKTGVLVPQQNMKSETIESLLKFKNFNKNVSQSLMPTYYIKGFKNILMPVDFFYSKTKQNELFDEKKLEEKALHLPDLSKQTSEISESNEDDKSDNIRETFGLKNQIKCKKNLIDRFWNVELEPDFEAQKHLSKGESKGYKKPVIVRSEKKLQTLDSEENSDDILPDKTCSGEVTLFVLKSDGTMQRKPPDPYVPPGLHLSYSLLRNFMLQPRFLQDSNMVISYVTDKDGNLTPHSDNLHQVVAEDGCSVSFMLSKNGGLLPVWEKKTENKSINYYFDGYLIHKSQQFTETFSNSTSVLINNEKFQIFKSADDSLKKDLLELKKISESLEKKNLKRQKNKKHRLRKRDLYYKDYDRNRGPGSIMADSQVSRQAPVINERNPALDLPRGQIILKSRQPNRELSPPIDSRPLDFLPPNMPPSSLPPAPLPVPIFEGNCKSSGAKNMYASPPIDSFEQPREEGSPDILPVPWDNAPLRPRTDIFIYDERGNPIRIIPEITDKNDVVIYKLTCKGNLVRYPPCKEPEFGFEIQFQLLLDEFILIPTINSNKHFLITYVLQENGDLIPAEENVNTFRKAPGSLIYYMLGKNNILFPVQQVLDMDGNVSFFYQDFFLFKMKDSIEKPLHFTTKGSPLFAFFNGFTVITMSSKPRLNTLRGSNWKNLKLSLPSDKPSTALYLRGPNEEMIKITPYKNKQSATVIYELDCNGILYRSPKDKKKCIILKSYILLKEGILMPSNDTTGYVYMMSKNGDMFPYLYPDGKIEAPLASSLKYVLCEKGILLPIKLEIVDNYICYNFNGVVVYKERVYSKSCLDRFYEENQEYKPPRKSSCDTQTKEIDKKFNSINDILNLKLFVNKDGENVFYEKQNKLLKRYPPETVPPYLKYTMGSFEVKPDGSLSQIQYQDPTENVVNLMLEPNGDLLEDTRNVYKNMSQYFVLDMKGNLIAVNCRITKKYMYFYKKNIRVCKIPIPKKENVKTENFNQEEISPPLGQDPLGLMDDPLPQKENNAKDSQSLYIPIPLKALSIADTPETCMEYADPEEKKKCQLLKDTLKQATKSSSLPLALELELTDDIMEELKNWASKCDKILGRRDIKNYFNEINYEKS